MPYPNKKSARREPSGDEPKSRRPKQSAKSYSLWLLSQRDYSEKALRTKLLAKEYPSDEIDVAVAYVQENKYQDDTRYARINAEGKASQQGNRRIRQALGQKGIAAAVITTQLEELAPEEERVLTACRRFVGKTLDQKLKMQVWRFLAYRGFSTGAIKTAMAHLGQAKGDSEDDEFDIEPEYS